MSRVGSSGMEAEEKRAFCPEDIIDLNPCFHFSLLNVCIIASKAISTYVEKSRRRIVPLSGDRSVAQNAPRDDVNKKFLHPLRDEGIASTGSAQASAVPPGLSTSLLVLQVLQIKPVRLVGLVGHSFRYNGLSRGRLLGFTIQASLASNRRVRSLCAPAGALKGFHLAFPSR